MRITEKKDGKHYGNANGKAYLVTDDRAEYFYDKSVLADKDYVNAVLRDIELWGTDLSALKGFVQAVEENYRYISEYGMIETSV